MPREFAERIRGTVLTREVTTTPLDSNHYEYPFPDDANASLYRRYRERAETVPNLLICGRLGEYRYYDMDQAIARALMLANQLLADPGPEVTPRVTWKSFRRAALQHA
jgi:UDP-galactopyranose mutase